MASILTMIVEIAFDR